MIPQQQQLLDSSVPQRKRCVGWLPSKAMLFALDPLCKFFFDALWQE